MIKLLKTKLFTSLTLLLTIFICFSADYQVKDGTNSIGTLSLNEPYNSTNYFNKTNYYDVALYYTNIIDEYRTNIVYVYVTNPPVVLSNKFPIVKITSPTNNQIFNGNSATIDVIAEASDSDGTISKVDFLVGGTVVNSDTSFPYNYSSLYGQGSYVLQARTYDNSNAFSLSEIVNILVTNIPPPVTPTNIPPTGNVRYVRVGATGNNSGSDWNNAYTSLPASLLRDYTYYVAAGSYPAFTFNTAHSGTLVTTVKKATSNEHGTDTGWNNLYAGQTVFASPCLVYRGYFVFDGSYRNEGNWFDGNSYGFKIKHNNDFTHLIIRDNSGNISIPNVTVKYLYVAAQIGVLGSRPYAIDTDTYSSTIRNPGYIFSRVYVEGSNNPFFVRNTIDPLIEYCASEKTSGSATYHGEVVNRFYSSSGVRGGGIVRYCHFRNCYDGTSGYPKGGGTGVIAISETSGMEIYGNIFESYYVGDGGIAAGWPNKNIKVYNNTFINGVQGSGALVRFSVSGGSGNVAYNNLAVNCANNTYNGQGTFGFNSIEPASIFVNFNNKDYHLIRKTTISGTTLSSPFNIDPDKKTRASDGFWDIGAYEF